MFHPASPLEPFVIPPQVQGRSARIRDVTQPLCQPLHLPSRAEERGQPLSLLNLYRRAKQLLY